MKNSNEIKRYVLFELNECEAIKEYLEEMALKGWRLKRIQTFFYFEEIQPQRLYYSVEIFSKASAYDITPSDSTKEYIDYCSEAGWNFVCNAGRINVFVSNLENPIPIETDESMKLDTISKGMIKQVMHFWLINIPIFFLYFPTRIMNFSSTVTSYANLISFLMYITLLAILISNTISIIIWIVKQKGRIKRGESIKCISRKEKKIRDKIKMIPVLIMIILMLFMIFMIFLESGISITLILPLIALMIIVIVSALLFSHLFYKKDRSKAFSKIVIAFVGLAMLILFCLITFTLLFLTLNNIEHENYKPRRTETFLASVSKYDYNLNDEERISITVFDSKYDFIINKYVYNETHKLFINNFIEINGSEWGAKAVFYSNGRYFIEYENYVISFFTKSEFKKWEIDGIKALINK